VRSTVDRRSERTIGTRAAAAALVGALTVGGIAVGQSAAFADDEPWRSSGDGVYAGSCNSSDPHPQPGCDFGNAVGSGGTGLPQQSPDGSASGTSTSPSSGSGSSSSGNPSSNGASAGTPSSGSSPGSGSSSGSSGSADHGAAGVYNPKGHLGEVVKKAKKALGTGKHLWGKGHGRFTTRGRYGAAIVRG
jgi:hypothetical protein